MLDLSVFKSRNWVVSTVTLCLMFGIFFGNIVLTPLWLQQWMGYTATWAGYATGPMGILAVLSSPIIGRLLPKVDPRLLVSYGMGVLAVSFVMRALLTSQADFMSVAVPMFVLGPEFPPALSRSPRWACPNCRRRKWQPVPGLQNFLRVMCMAVGSSLTQTYWEHMTKFNRAELVTAINPDVPGIVSNTLGAAGIPTDTSAALFSRMIDSQAIMLATNDFYQSATVLMLGP